MCAASCSATESLPDRRKSLFPIRFFSTRSAARFWHCSWTLASVRWHLRVCGKLEQLPVRREWAAPANIRTHHNAVFSPPCAAPCSATEFLPGPRKILIPHQDLFEKGSGQISAPLTDACLLGSSVENWRSWACFAIEQPRLPSARITAPFLAQRCAAFCSATEFLPKFTDSLRPHRDFFRQGPCPDFG